MFWLGLCIGLVIGGNVGIVVVTLLRINKK